LINEKKQIMGLIEVEPNAINSKKIRSLTPSHLQIPDRVPGQATGPEEPEKTGFLLPDQVEDRLRRNHAETCTSGRWA